MTDALDREYFEWLCEQALPNPRSKSLIRTHWKLFNLLYRIEFRWFVRNDENRSADGIEFRRLFVREKEIEDYDEDWFSSPCSVLELLLGMALRLEFMDGGDAKEWLWEMLENAGIIFAKTNDLYWDGQIADAIKERIELIINREYDFSGEGGFFPNPGTDNDQRKTELWYQMCEYIVRDM